MDHRCSVPLLLLLTSLAGCVRPSPRPHGPGANTPAANPSATPPVAFTPAATPDVYEPPPPTREEIIVAGQRYKIDVPVITWEDEGGFNGYQETCFFSDRALPKNPVAGCDTPQRYSADGRRGLYPPLAHVVGAQGWSPPLAAVAIDQFVVHYDAAWTAQNCFKVLHDLRGLSVHFMLDVDGTIYQSLDVVERARHAGKANDRSIGIEIAHPGVLQGALGEFYEQDASGTWLDLGPRQKHVRTPGFVVRPTRAEAQQGTIHGRSYRQYDFTDAQYESLCALLGHLHKILPRLPLAVPEDAEGRLITTVLSEAQLAEFSGVIGHFHVSHAKVDPGPAFDWERVLAGARLVAGETAIDERED